MKTVTIVSDAYYPLIDGVVRFVDALGVQLSHHGFHVNLVIPKVPRRPLFNTDIRPFDFYYLPTIPIDIQGYFICLPNKELRRVLSESDIIIVNSLAFSTAYILYLNKYYSKPIIQFVHADEREVIQHAGKIPFAIVNQVFRVMKYFTSKMDYFAVATNKFYRRSLEYNIPPEKIFRVPFGYARKEIDQEKKTKVFSKFNIIEDQINILYLGRLSEEKNIKRIWKLMEKLSIDNSLPISCYIAGFGHLDRWIVRQGKKRDVEIRFLGKIPDEELPYVYHAADLFLSPSFHESFGFTIVEAMSYGIIPAVNGNNREELLTDKNTIYLEDITDVDSMYKQIIEVLSDRKIMLEMQKEVLKTSNQFTWKVFGEIWAKQIDSILKTNLLIQ